MINNIQIIHNHLVEYMKFNVFNVNQRAKQNIINNNNHQSNIDVLDVMTMWRNINLFVTVQVVVIKNGKQ